MDLTRILKLLSNFNHFWLIILNRNLWEVIDDFSEENKKKFLSFCTGSDRVPVGGLSSLKFHISKNGPDSDK